MQKPWNFLYILQHVKNIFLIYFSTDFKGVLTGLKRY